MKILCISDTVVAQMENAAHLRRRYHDVELVVSCGDLPAYYIEYITSVLSAPLFYVRGNHDESYDERPPGGENIHQQIITYKGLTFAGLEGSIRYNNGAIQYTEGQMLRMVLGMWSLRYQRARHGYGLDVLVTHSPAQGIHDMPDLPHHGFKSLLRFMDWYHPRYMIHGHVHTWDRRTVTQTNYQDTCIMNINPVTLLEVDPAAPER